jgi:hypothetical protein
MEMESLSIVRRGWGLANRELPASSLKVTRPIAGGSGVTAAEKNPLR